MMSSILGLDVVLDEYTIDISDNLLGISSMKFDTHENTAMAPNIKCVHWKDPIESVEYPLELAHEHAGKAVAIIVEKKPHKGKECLGHILRLILTLFCGVFSLVVLFGLIIGLQYA
jgi:hypothetical protein